MTLHEYDKHDTQPDGICNPARNVSWLDGHGYTH